MSNPTSGPSSSAPVRCWCSSGSSGCSRLQAPPTDTWVEVTGTWIPQTFKKMPTGVVYPQLTGKGLTRIEPPEEPYE
ncbi:hypothetical protein [Streptosporangium sp. NPDC002607]